jgi:DNA ligase-1
VREFAALYAALDATTSTHAKLAALEGYFARAAPADAAWAVWFLCGNKPRQVVPVRVLQGLAMELAEVPPWLFDECYQAVGDLAETIAHLLPAGADRSGLPLARWVEERLLPLRGQDEAAVRERLAAWWAELDANGRLVCNKLVTGAFRVGVSRQLVTRALGRVAGLEPRVVAERMAGDWQPGAERYTALLRTQAQADGEDPLAAPGQPYPFFLAHALQGEPASLGAIGEWLAEWKWDGIRAQLVRRRGSTFVWSRGEDLVTERFPEIAALGARLPDGTVLDGEIVAWGDDAPLPFGALQQRIGRKALSARVLAQVPVAFVAYDLLESCARDQRTQALDSRRTALARLVDAVADPRLRLSPLVAAPDWTALAHLRGESRQRGVEGLVLKRRDSSYGVGRTRGDWWKWKVDPYSVDAVLVYAQRGHGRRASLYTDYTFAVWSGGELVPFAKAYSGLTDAEIREVDDYVRRNTVEKFGPVRSVAPQLVMEIGFEGIQRSPRHKSGVAVRFPRILRLRRDKPVEEADTLGALQSLLAAHTASG